MVVGVELRDKRVKKGTRRRTTTVAAAAAAQGYVFYLVEQQELESLSVHIIISSSPHRKD